VSSTSTRRAGSITVTYRFERSKADGMSSTKSTRGRATTPDVFTCMRDPAKTLHDFLMFHQQVADSFTEETRLFRGCLRSPTLRGRPDNQEQDATRQALLPESGGTVVVADDTPAIGEYYARLLRREGHRVVVAHNGTEAFDAIAREQPDVALLDVMMPERSGFDVCQAVKSDPNTRLIPVVLVTALQNIEDRIRGIEAGADDFSASRRTLTSCWPACARSSD
jgi:CheY-like chemotaxis protein